MAGLASPSQEICSESTIKDKNSPAISDQIAVRVLDSLQMSAYHDRSLSLTLRVHSLDEIGGATPPVGTRIADGRIGLSAAA